MFSIPSSSQVISINTAPPQGATPDQPSLISTDLSKTSNAPPRSDTPPHLDAMQNLAIKGSASFTPTFPRMSMYSCPADVNPIGEPHLNKDAIAELDEPRTPPSLPDERKYQALALKNYTSTNAFDLNDYTCLLGDLIKKPVGAIIKNLDLQTPYKLTAKEINMLNQAADYHGFMILFAGDSSKLPGQVKSYLVRALAKAPEYILKLALGYVEGGVGKTVVVKAWRDKSTNIVRYKMIDYKAGSTVNKQEGGSLSRLSNCSEMWLYETGKRVGKLVPSAPLERKLKTIG